MITSFNFYYAQPGQEDAVLRQRLRACDVRDNMGVPCGRVLARSAGAAELPDVIWEHQFDNVDGHHADMAARAASAEFEAIRAGMRKLCRRFERPLFEISADAAATAQAPERTAAQKQSGRLCSILGQPSLVSRKSATPRCRYFRRCSRKADARQPRSQMERRYTAVFL